MAMEQERKEEETCLRYEEVIVRDDGEESLLKGQLWW